jgi:hypothetical protein
VIIAFLVGIILAGMGVMMSIATGNWQLSLVISGIIAASSIVITSILSNISFIFGRRVLVGKENFISIEQAGRLAKIITALGIPNIIVALAVYFMIIR